MQENNNFETIISKWRRISVVERQEVRKENFALASMSGDSSNHDALLKNNEDEHSRDKAWAGAVAETSGLPAADNPGGKGVLSNQNKDKQESSSDTDCNSIESEPRSGNTTDSEPRSGNTTDSEVKSEKEKLEDNVDSVYLRPPPAHKRAASASPPQEEDCGIKCLYYTLQCCDCVLM